jgi:glutamine phosphoribosylpyrophosphate amidotransferase
MWMCKAFSHFVSPYPPFFLSSLHRHFVRFCRYDELIATHMTSVEGIRDYIKADSLEYLTHDGMMQAVRAGTSSTDCDGNSTPVGHCSACMTGAYPVEFDP